jgi:hypothetical protein
MEKAKGEAMAIGVPDAEFEVTAMGGVPDAELDINEGTVPPAPLPPLLPPSPSGTPSRAPTLLSIGSNTEADEG